MTDPTWMAHAACSGRDARLWFPEEGESPSPEALMVCDACPVREACLESALAEPKLAGVWGGLSHKQRSRERRSRRGSRTVAGSRRPADAGSAPRPEPPIGAGAHPKQEVPA